MCNLVTVEETIAHCAVRSSYDLKASLILAFTHSGRTASILAKHKPRCPSLFRLPGEFLVQNLSGKCEQRMDKDVVEKCLAFCQALTSNNHLFSFSLKIGNDAFNFDLKELAKSSCIKKKKSPSQMRRETRRREERRRAATKAEEDIAETSEQSANVKPKCDSCDTSFNSEEELSAHIQSVHTTPEKERGSESQIELKLSPI